MVKQQYAAELDQAPETVLGAVIGNQYKRVVRDTELEHLRQVRMSPRNGVEPFLWDAEGDSAAAERRVALQTLGQTLGSDSVGKPADEPTLWEVPLMYYLCRTFPKQLVLEIVLERWCLAANELGFRLRDKPRGKLEELFGVLRTSEIPSCFT